MLSVLDYKIIARPNNSLSTEGSLKLLVVLGLLAFIVAVGFAKAGAWLVMPFAGLELVAFGLAFHHIQAHSADFESIAIEGDTVTIESVVRKDTTTTVFQRYWTQVVVKKTLSGKNGLFIGSHGKEIEFGKHFIDDEQRYALMQELKRKLKNINEV